MSIYNHELRKFDSQVLSEGTYLVMEDASAKEMLELLKNWKTSNADHSRKTFKNDSISEDDYTMLSDTIHTIRSAEDYATYKKAFDKLCAYAHIVPKGTIITKLELKSGSKKDTNILEVEYTENTKKIKLPESIKLYHLSKVEGIKELIPVFRGKSAKGFLYDKSRIYLTIHKQLPKFLADYHWYDKLHKYMVKVPVTDVYVDPLVWSGIQGAVYVETEKPIPVEEVGIKKNTGNKEEKKEEEVKESVELIEEGLLSKFINKIKKFKKDKKVEKTKVPYEKKDKPSEKPKEYTRGTYKEGIDENRKKVAQEIINKVKPYINKLNAGVTGSPYKIMSYDDKYNKDFWKTDWFDDDGTPDYSDELILIDFDAYDIPNLPDERDDLLEFEPLNKAYSNADKYFPDIKEALSKYGEVDGDGEWDGNYFYIDVKASAIKGGN